MFLGKVTWDGLLSLLLFWLRYLGMPFKSHHEMSKRKSCLLPAFRHTNSKPHSQRTPSSNAEGKGTDWYIRKCGTSISFTYVLAQVKKPTINEIKDSSCYMLDATYHEQWIYKYYFQSLELFVSNTHYQEALENVLNANHDLRHEWYA